MPSVLQYHCKLAVEMGESDKASDCAGKLLVNFDKGIQEVMWESRWLGHLGFQVPQPAQAILLQEEKFNVYYQQLSHALEASHPPHISGRLLG